MIIIDFPDGAHGRFLRALIDRYIFNLDFNLINVFSKSGAAHNNYNDSMINHYGHYTVNNNIININEADKIVYIYVPKKTYFISRVNSFYRSNIGGDIQYNMHLNNLINFDNTTIDIKNKFYDQLQQYKPIESSILSSKSFILNHELFFNFFNLVKILEKISKYVNLKFTYDDSLLNAWQHFMKVNTGYQKNELVQNLLNDIVKNIKTDIPDDFMIHAYLNLHITEMFDIWDGELFKENYYPKCTSEVYKIIKETLKGRQ